MDNAAVKIQSVARGRQERKKHAERKARKKEPPKTEAEKEGEEMAANAAFADLDKAAVKIQSIARGRQERQKHAERKARKNGAPKAPVESASTEAAPKAGAPAEMPADVACAPAPDSAPLLAERAYTPHLWALRA